MELLDTVLDHPELLDTIGAKLQQPTPETPKKANVRNTSGQLNERPLENHDVSEEQYEAEKEKQQYAEQLEQQEQIVKHTEIHEGPIKQRQKPKHELIEEPIQIHKKHIPVNKQTQQVISAHYGPLANLLVQNTFPPEKTTQTAEPKPKQNEEDENHQSVISNLSKSFANNLVANTIPQYKKPEKAKKIKPVQTLQCNKCLYLIFSHFCKENYLSSIKSTLFQDKKKSMEEMPLNKWMVFCKQFDIFNKICSLKIQKRKSSGEEVQSATIDNSRVKEQIKVKETKEVQKILGQIFKKSSQNHTKMQFHHFIEAVKLLNGQFKTHSEQIKDLSDLEFAKRYLYCQSEHECMHKLSNLKFTFGIPQIDYSKVIVTPVQRQKSQSKFNSHDLKQNIGQQVQILRKKTKGSIGQHSKTMHLNSIIKDAKNTLANAENKISITTHRKPGSRLKLNLDQSKPAKAKKAGKQDEVSELMAYFDSTNDEILQSYFKGEKMLTAFQKSK